MARHISPALVLARAERRLAERADYLEAKVADGIDMWAEYLDTIRTLLALQATKDRAGTLLTTKDMAERLRMKPKSLLRKVSRGEIRPAVRKGRMIRWRGTEATG